MVKTVTDRTWRTMIKYIVEEIATETDEEILRFCDASFGGDIVRGKNGTAFVTAYID